MTTTVPFDIPQPWAGPVIAAIATAFAFLMLVDWTHPDHDRPESE